MKRKIFTLFFLLLPLMSMAQWSGWGNGVDSLTIRFSNSVSSNYVGDTATVPLWQVGRSQKSFFGSDTTTAIMTDTLNTYPVDVNNYFVVKIPSNYYYIPLVEFWHRYETTSAHDGGLVEFSLDYGVTWQNVKGHCNTDSGMYGDLFGGVLTAGIYTFNDTLATGQPSFSGTSDSSVFSQVLFYANVQKLTNGIDCRMNVDTIYLRFRFISDSTADTLAGWEIDSIKVRYYLAGGGFASNLRKYRNLSVLPNPSADGRFIFPDMQDGAQYIIEVYNAMGSLIAKTPYTINLDLNQYPKGLYFYKVSGKEYYYSGQLLSK